MKITLSIPVAARGQGRPRFARGRAYKHRDDKEYEDVIAVHYRKTVIGIPLWDGPVAMTVSAFYERPKSRKNTLFMTSRPDADNIAKAVADALNGLAYRDDAQIVSLASWKGYGEENRIDIEIERIGDGNEDDEEKDHEDKIEKSSAE